MMFQPQRQSYHRRVAILVLSQALCSSLLLAFAPTSQLQTTVARSSHATDMDGKPYFADFSTEKVNIRLKDDGASIIPTTTIHGNKQVGVGKTAVVAGSSGYIGRACVRECVARGYNTIALVRDTSRASSDEALNGASLVKCDVTNEEEVQSLLKEITNGSHHLVNTATANGRTEIQSPPPVDLMISCLASPSGKESEVYAVDYQASLNLLNAGSQPSVEARHFILLSAFCCRNPILKLQQAKLEFEKKLAEQSDMTYSIIRPTAFFKSVSGQYDSILAGNSYVLFGDGAVTQCNPISEEELAIYMCDSSLEEYREQRWGKILNVGGPDEPLSNKMLGEMMFKAINKPAKFVYVPTEIFDISISMIEFIAKTWPSQKWEDVLETSKIGKYYAVEDMLTTKDEEKFGSISMMDHFEKIAREGQDPFTPVRATAIIAKTLEALPVVSVSVPLGLGLLSKPNLLENVMGSSPLDNVPILVAALNDNNIIS